MSPYVSRRLVAEIKGKETTIKDLEVHTLGPVVVVLAEPGAGKTAFVRALREGCAAKTVTGAAFVSWGGGETVAPNDLLVIDALDEVAGRQWGEGVHKVLDRLHQLGRPRIVITCRAAEWEGARNKSLIRELYGVEPVEARFAPFTEEELRALCNVFDSSLDAGAFLKEASRRDLEELLQNAETLHLLIDAVRDGSWPNTRSELFERAIDVSLRETNPRRMEFDGQVDRANLIEAAGEIFASILISGSSGVHLERQDVPGYPNIANVGATDMRVRRAAIKTRLFKDDGSSLAPTHRMVAEYVGAKFLAERVLKRSISQRRMSTALAPDGYVRSDLRGLHAWMAALGPREFQRQAIRRDPYGVLRYGDPSVFSLSEKRLLLRELQNLASDDPYFRAADGWTQPLITGFLVPEMRGDVVAAISNPDRNLHLSTLLLGAMQESDFAESVSVDLKEIVDDEARPYGERAAAAEALYPSASMDWPAVVDRLAKRRSSNSARLCLEIISDRGGLGLRPSLIADAIAEAMLLNSTKEHPDLSTRDYRVVRRLPRELLAPTLDRLAERMTPMCRDRFQHTCRCLLSLSPTVHRLLDRYFSEKTLSWEAPRIWEWLRYTHDRNFRDDQRATTQVLSEEDELRRAIQAIAIEDKRFEDSSWMALCRLGDKQAGLRLSEDDIVFHMTKISQRQGLGAEEAVIWSDLVRIGFRSDAIRRLAEAQADKDGHLRGKWEELNAPRQTSDADVRHEAYMQGEKRKSEENRRARIASFALAKEAVEQGKNLGWLLEISRAHLKHFYDIPGETSEERLANLVGEEGVASAISGLCAALNRDDLPTLEHVAVAQARQKHLDGELLVCAGIWAHSQLNGGVGDLSVEVLSVARASWHFNEAFSEDMRKEIEQVVFGTPNRIERFVKVTCEAQFEAGCRSIHNLYLLTWDQRFSHCAGSLAMEWLRDFPRAPGAIRHDLLKAAILHANRDDVTELVRRRCAEIDLAEREWRLEAIDPVERELWIPAAFLLDFDAHKSIVHGFAEEARSRLWLFRAVSEPNIAERKSELAGGWPRLSVRQNQFLLDRFAAQWPRTGYPRGTFAGDTNGWDASEFLRRRAQAIAVTDIPAAGEALEELIRNLSATGYAEELRHHRASWRRRQSSLRLEIHEIGEVRELVSGGGPTSVADLQAMMMDALEWLRDDLKTGDTKGWTAFWRTDKPHTENDCRDRIIERLRPRFEIVNVQLRPECRMPEDKRADIVASLLLKDEIHDLPVEVKGQWHDEIWSACVEQLDHRYARYINARGRGIYLVLWFGRIPKYNLRGRPDERPLPNTPQELEAMLLADLPPSLRGRIEVFVIDASMPVAA